MDCRSFVRGSAVFSDAEIHGTALGREIGARRVWLGAALFFLRLLRGFRPSSFCCGDLHIRCLPPLRLFPHESRIIQAPTSNGWRAPWVLGDDSLHRLDPTGGLDWHRSAAPQEICGPAAFRNRVRVVCQWELGLQQVAHGRSIHRSCGALPLII